MFTPVPMTYFCGVRKLSERGLFNSTTSDKTCKLSHKFSCCDKCLVNLHKYKLCLKQYVDQTVDEFKFQ